MIKNLQENLFQRNLNNQKVQKCEKSSRTFFKYLEDNICKIKEESYKNTISKVLSKICNRNKISKIQYNVCKDMISLAVRDM